MGGVPTPLPAVVAHTRKQQRRAASLREWKRGAPAFVVAAALHLLALWALDRYFGVLGIVAPTDQVIVASLDDSDPFEPEEELTSEPPLEEPPALPEPIVEELPEVVEQFDDPDDVVAGELDILGLGASGLGGRGPRAQQGGLGGPTGLVAGLSGASTGFRGFVEDLRNRGLDVVFVVDATGSMRAFIDRARETIDDIIVDLSAVVPSLRLGVVAYRDLDDEWVTRDTGLTVDRYLIHNFLIDLEAAGGKRGTPDFEEAVEVGLEVAAEWLPWRAEARRVIIVVGDAPYHEDDQRRTMDLARDFSRGDQGLVNTIYVGNVTDGRPTENQRLAMEAMDRIARAGDGNAFQLMTDADVSGEALRRRITDATFGPQWADEIAALLQRLPDDARRATVQRHVEKQDRRWLLGRLKKLPLHPAIPKACIELFDRSVAQECLALVLDGKRPEPLRSAALYVLKRGLDAEIPFDVRLSAASQSQAVARFQREIEGVPLARKPTGGHAPPPGSTEAPPR